MGEWTEWNETQALGTDEGGYCVVVNHTRTRDTGDGSQPDRQFHSGRAALPGEVGEDGEPKQSESQIIAALHVKVRAAR